MAKARAANPGLQRSDSCTPYRKPHEPSRAEGTPPADAGVTAPAGCRAAREMRRAAEEAAALQSHTETQ
jgi:hypothetical protein